MLMPLMPQITRKIVIILLSATIQSVSGFWLAATVAHAENRVIGTIELSVDGQAQSWYILQPPGHLLPTALWVPMGPGRGAAAIGAYSAPDIKFVEDATTGASVPVDAQPVLTLSFGFPTGTEALSYDLPVGRGEGPATVILQANWKDYTTTFDMSDGPGEIRVDSIKAIEKGNSEFAGSFRGQLQSRDGSVKRVTNGRFHVNGARYFQGKGAR
ncbi:MAG: hypothetical protein PVG38_00625 [Gammaproteobacteria bacterium]|jgi:hypothetical protein